MAKNEIAELISSTAELVSALKSKEGTPAEKEKAREERIRSLQLALEEQRRDYDVVRSVYDSVKTRTITYLAAALAILAYLFTADGSQQSLRERLFFPEEPYGVVFYAAGFLLLLLAIISLMVALVKSREWHTAYDDNQEESLIEDYERYLTYMHHRYLKISSINGNNYAKRSYLLRISFLPLVIGATILLLLKTFGG